MQQFIETESFTLVDSGAGDGTFLDVARPSFRQAFGTDISPTAKRILTNKGYLLNRPLSQFSPKVVTALQVIEHISNPREFISDLQLKPADWLVVTSPAPDSPTAQRFHRKGEWRSLSPSHHLCLFSRSGLERLAADCGLNLVHIEYTYSGCHGAVDNIYRTILAHLKYPIKRAIGRKDPFPVFYGKNSFIAILRKRELHFRQ